MRFLEEEEEEESSSPDTTSTEQPESITESEEDKQERLDKEIAELNAQTQKAFENTFDVSEDYRYEDMDQYKSGHFSDDDDERLAKYGSIMMSAPVSTNGYIYHHFYRLLNFWNPQPALMSTSRNSRVASRESTALITMDRTR